ncbi:hypothetical protein STEG23_017076, partial [Scotinomys teguina]
MITGTSWLNVNLKISVFNVHLYESELFSQKSNSLDADVKQALPFEKEPTVHNLFNNLFWECCSTAVIYCEHDSPSPPDLPITQVIYCEHDSPSPPDLPFTQVIYCEHDPPSPPDLPITQVIYCEHDSPSPPDLPFTQIYIASVSSSAKNKSKKRQSNRTKQDTIRQDTQNKLYTTICPLNLTHEVNNHSNKI